MIQLDNVSLFYKNVHVLSHNSHGLSMFKSFGKDIFGKTMHKGQKCLFKSVLRIVIEQIIQHDWPM